MHYITISNVQFLDRTSTRVNIYDSCWKNIYEPDQYSHIALKVSELITIDEHKQLSYVTYQPIQSDEAESYLYALLFAYCIASNRDPFTVTVEDHNKLKDNVTNFLRTGSFGRNVNFQNSAEQITSMRSRRSETYGCSCFLTNHTWMKCSLCAEFQLYLSCTHSSRNASSFLCAKCKNISNLPPSVLVHIFTFHCAREKGNLKPLRLSCRNWNR